MLQCGFNLLELVLAIIALLTVLFAILFSGAVLFRVTR
jgi:hypothetical protein